MALGAEYVEKVEPLLATYNAKGEVEGVKSTASRLSSSMPSRNTQPQVEQQRN